MGLSLNTSRSSAYRIMGLSKRSLAVTRKELMFPLHTTFDPPPKKKKKQGTSEHPSGVWELGFAFGLAAAGFQLGLSLGFLVSYVYVFPVWI